MCAADILEEQGHHQYHGGPGYNALPEAVTRVAARGRHPEGKLGGKAMGAA